MKDQNELILLDIRSAHNVGAIFRTADAAGISKIYLVGITPAPLDRFGRVRKDVAKAALGAEKIVKWESRKSVTALLRELKKDKVQIIALEQSKKSVDYKKIKPKNSFCLVLGNEVLGIPSAILSHCDKIVEIPMHGKKESLNVSVAVGIALFQMLGV